MRWPRESVITTTLIAFACIVIMVVFLRTPQPTQQPKSYPQESDFDVVMWNDGTDTAPRLNFRVKKWPESSSTPDDFFSFMVPACLEDVTIKADTDVGGGNAQILNLVNVPDLEKITNSVLSLGHLGSTLGAQAGVEYYNGTSPAHHTMYVQTDKKQDDIKPEDWRIVIIAVKGHSGTYTFLWDKVITPTQPPR